MRLRTGAHHLAVETGRWSRPVIPRQFRTCSKCTQTIVEDEMHLLAGPHGPTYSDAYTIAAKVEMTRHRSMTQGAVRGKK